MKRNNWLKFGIIGAVIVVALLVGGVLLVRYNYNHALQPVSNSQNLVFVTVESGATVQEIAVKLKEQGVIRETWAFEWYVRSSGLTGELKAGTYALTPSQSVEEIAEIVARGEVATDLVTIVPGTRIDQVEAAMVNSGFAPAAVERALNPNLYADHPALVDKPKKASLEGYLYPESFQKTDATEPEDIIRASLDEMHQVLTPSLRAAIAKQGLSIHEGITLASIIEREVPSKEDKAKVAQVFLTRLKQGINLESDATASYGAILDGAETTYPEVLTYSSPYNTYENKGLPPGPISNVSVSSLKAVANPSNTDFLFFVSGDDGKTYFSRTLAEHEENVARYCTKLCQ
jgi:UPF0755 protein